MSKSAIEEILSVDELIGEPSAVFKFSIKDKVYEAFASNDLPERFQLRLLEAETDFAELNEEIYPQLQSVASELEKAQLEMQKLTDKDKPVPTTLYLKIRKLQQQESSLNVKLVAPARNAIEAMCKLEKGSLAYLPIKATNQIYSKIMDSLYKMPETVTENATEGNDSLIESASEATLAE